MAISLNHLLLTLFQGLKMTKLDHLENIFLSILQHI